MKHPVFVVIFLLASLAGCASDAAKMRAEVDVPAIEPPPPAKILSRDEVIEMAQIEPTDKAIQKLDQHPFDFSLNPENLKAIEGSKVAPDVMDYLRKRAQVDWASLRSEPRLEEIPESPPLVQPTDLPEEYLRPGNRPFSPITPRIYRIDRRYRRYYGQRFLIRPLGGYQVLRYR